MKFLYVVIFYLYFFGNNFCFEDNESRSTSLSSVAEGDTWYNGRGKSRSPVFGENISGKSVNNFLNATEEYRIVSGNSGLKLSHTFLKLISKFDPMQCNFAVSETIPYRTSMSDILHFSQLYYGSASIKENVAKGTAVDGLENFVLLGNATKYLHNNFCSITEGNIDNAFVLTCNHLTENGFVLFKLYSTKRLDRECVSVYYLTIDVSDATGVYKAKTTVRVTVENENDNYPIFEKLVYRFTVPKCADTLSSNEIYRNFYLGSVLATDKDGDKVKYELLTNTDVFLLESITGKLFYMVDMESVDKYNVYELVIGAADSGTPHLKAKYPAHVIIELFPSDICNILDSGIYTTNSFPVTKKLVKRRVPRAIRPTKRYDFLETAGAVEGSVVFKLDKESEREVFVLRYTNPWVTVDKDGSVRVKKKWDYEELGPDKTFDFWVNITTAIDVEEDKNWGVDSTDKTGKKFRGKHRGRHNKSRPLPERPYEDARPPEIDDTSGDTQRIIVGLSDVNDEVPYFINRPLPMQAVVQLNAPPSTPVFTLQARDPDTEADIHYFIVRDRTGGRFEVDERSGIVRTRGNDPFQLDMEYVLYVKAEDQNGRTDNRKVQSTSEERLSIVGGKRAPQFYMQSYEAEVPENRQRDSDIISVKAKSFADREIRYTLKAQGQGAGTFNIEATSGIVKLTKELDFEDLRQPHVYALIITATEDSGGFSTSVELTIRVTDVNDNAPKFELPDYQAHNIDEDIPLGTSIIRVRAVDADSGANAEISYFVNNDHFTVDAAGVIRNSKQLDADYNNGYYELVVTAKDKGDPPLSGTSNVRVYTKNKNDEEPKFSQQVYTPNVDENAGPNTLVTTVVASDKDGDNVKFKFVGGSPSSGQFVIEEVTGVIRLHSKPVTLDRDKYELNVTAIDDGSCCVNGDSMIHTSTAVVVVFITDVNDNKPVFKDCAKYNPKVPEGAPSGYNVTKVRATDLDKGINGQVKYSIVQQPNQKGTKFIIDEESGLMWSNKVFDREGDDGKFVSVTVKATDLGDPPLEGVCSFTVEILDINDNPPLFDRQRYIENVKQDAAIGTPILRVSASDEDADNNGAVMYSLKAVDNMRDIEYFEVQPESGWIVLKKALDREAYRLEVTAQDRGYPPLSRSVEVRIEVVDRANNPPVWDHNFYGPISVKENVAVGAKVVSIKASSGIEGNPVVFYSLMPGSIPETNKLHTFYLQQRQENGFTWADIKVNHPLDYETVTQYNLTVRVENNGAQQLATETTVFIMVEDVNDEIPLFTEREQETVLEGEPIGTKVTQVNAIDKDGTSPNNKVYYYIVDSVQSEGANYFTINETTGEIYTKAVFDREKQGAYALEIEAKDGAPSARPHNAGSPNSVTKFIRIGIADKNDNPPYFDKPLYEAEVDENEDIQHTVLTVTAKDHDESSRIRYEITSGNVGGAFAVKNMTGAIYVAGPLDYETRKRYELRLSASDNLYENHTTVVIHVKDVNDNPPTFDKPTYESAITEEYDKSLPLFVVRVNATDGDKDRPANIVYFLTGQGIDKDNPANSKFEINRTTGVISVLKPLDRDQPNGRPQWRFTVFAQDDGGEGLVGYADVLVNLRDINDNYPFFPYGIYYGNVTENGTDGMVVMTMTAIDYDDPAEGTNAKLTYHIEKNAVDEATGSTLFEIEPYTGVIKTAICCLDRERTPEYTVIVVATDGGGQKGTGTAVIRVKDVNDMPPRFSKDEWHAEVDETDGNNIPDTPILTVTVNDEDESNKFQYKVMDNTGYGADKFTMVRNNDGTGSLKVVQPLDYEDPLQTKGFRFRILVNDKGEDNDNDKYHTATSWVAIKLRDINDNKPQFERQNVEVSVYENAEIGRSLETFKAFDPDQDGKGKVSFLIDRSSDKRRQFRISQDGTVTIQRSLDRETIPRHEIKILAIDDGVPPKTSTATLTVIVQDINDNAPRFLYNYQPVIPEHVQPRKVIEVLATDDDDRSKSNGPPFIFKLDPNADDVIKGSFKVEHDQKGANGDGMAIVTSLKAFDREQLKEYLVPIIIKDSGDPPMSSTNTLTITIGDVNDNKMLPGSKEILVYNFMGRAPESQIGRVYVHDLDDWDLPDKSFRWDGSEPPQFILDEDTGMISLRPGVRQGEYFLKFKVYDRKHTQANINANVTVNIKEISRDVVRNSGSVRITGITDEDFIRTWNYKTHSNVKSKLEYLSEKFAQILGTKNIQIFSVQLRNKYPPMIDVFFSTDDHQDVLKVNGRILMFREEIENDIGVNISMVGINECVSEGAACEGSCTNRMDVLDVPYLVDANNTALVGVQIDMIADCTCSARNYTAIETCQTLECFNGGSCVRHSYESVSCRCPPGTQGPRCQINSRTFSGDGWAWFPPLRVCSDNHLSLEFMTRKEEGLMFYNGPIVAPKAGEELISDFMSLELDQGIPRLLVDYGSGTLELKMNSTKVNDNQWHRIDILWDIENVKIILDRCIAGVRNNTEGAFSVESCHAQGTIPPFNEYLNLNIPFQLGGRYIQNFDPILYSWQSIPYGKSFEGCIRNVQVNGMLYDLGYTGFSVNTEAGCLESEIPCLQRNLHCEHGTCDINFRGVYCKCDSGWSGSTCREPAQSGTFNPQSYIQYGIVFDLNQFSTEIHAKFRTREINGELINIRNDGDTEYGILEVRDKKLLFHYNLDALRRSEKDIRLSHVQVNDGQWHTVIVSRRGSTVILQLDGGEKSYYNETFDFFGHQLLNISKQDGVTVGGTPLIGGQYAHDVRGDFQRSCISDVRLNGLLLPIFVTNRSEPVYIHKQRNIERGCISRTNCSTVECKPPFMCVDNWNEAVCSCGPGKIKLGERKCVDKDECLERPCMNGGYCENLEYDENVLGYRCICQTGFGGHNCEVEQEEHDLGYSLNLLILLLMIFLLVSAIVLIIIYISRWRQVEPKFDTSEEDIRENIINYNDEGGGEDDVTTYDLSALRVPIYMPATPTPRHGHVAYTSLQEGIPFVSYPNMYPFLMDKKMRTDIHPGSQPYDDLRIYMDEGIGSVAESLSSLTDVTDDEDQEYDYLETWGPRFHKLADMYNQDDLLTDDEFDDFL